MSTTRTTERGTNGFGSTGRKLTMKPRHLVLILVIIMTFILTGCEATPGDDFTLIERQITLHDGNTITCVLVDETSPEDNYVDIAGVTCNF